LRDSQACCLDHEQTGVSTDLPLRVALISTKALAVGWHIRRPAPVLAGADSSRRWLRVWPDSEDHPCDARLELWMADRRYGEHYRHYPVIQDWRPEHPDFLRAPR
jgi:hypothetical protein